MQYFKNKIFLSNLLLFGYATQQPIYESRRSQSVIDSNPSNQIVDGQVKNKLKECCSSIGNIQYKICSHTHPQEEENDLKVELAAYKVLFSNLLSYAINSHNGVVDFLDTDLGGFFEDMISSGLLSDLDKIVAFNPGTLSNQYGGRTLLHVALSCEGGVQKGSAPYNSLDHDTREAIHKIVDLLIQKSPSSVLSMQDNTKNTPFHLLADLHYARVFGNIENTNKSRAESLISPVATFVNLENDQQRTPLHTAMRFLIKMLPLDSKPENKQQKEQIIPNVRPLQ